MVCETMCLAPRVSKRSTPTWGMPPLAPSCSPIAKSSSCASSQKGAYAGSCSVRPLYGFGRRKPPRMPSSRRAKRISSMASSIDCIGSMATPNRRSG